MNVNLFITGNGLSVERIDERPVGCGSRRCRLAWSKYGQSNRMQDTDPMPVLVGGSSNEAPIDPRSPRQSLSPEFDMGPYDLSSGPLHLTMSLRGGRLPNDEAIQPRIVPAPRDYAQSIQVEDTGSMPVLFGGNSSQALNNLGHAQRSPTPEANLDAHDLSSGSLHLSIRLRGGPLPDDEANQPKTANTPEDAPRVPPQDPRNPRPEGAKGTKNTRWKWC